jgi:hypothetical protein
MAPEQIEGKPIDISSDIFSLGIVLYEITVGKRLFRGTAREVIGRLTEAKIDPPTFVRRKFPPALEAIVMRTLEKHPDARYQSAYDLADDLEAFLRDAHMHSGPVRIARYLDVLTQAAGGPRRPELVSEDETRSSASGELDFDGPLFDAFAPAAVKEWEDTEQPEADVAAALGLELAELRALRTPAPLPSDGPDAEADATTPVSRISAEEAQRSSDDDLPTLSTPALPPAGAPSAVDPGHPPAPAAPPAGASPSGPAASSPTAPPTDASPGWQASIPAAPRSAPLAVPVPVPVPIPVPMAPPMVLGSGPGAIGSEALGPPGGLRARHPEAPRGFGQRLPWILVGVLVVAVTALVAYIVIGIGV